MNNHLLYLFQKDLTLWKSRLNDFEGLERFMIQIHIDKLETTIKTYIEEKGENKNG